jgi:hypothetical protein
MNISKISSCPNSKRQLDIICSEKIAGVGNESTGRFYAHGGPDNVGQSAAKEQFPGIYRFDRLSEG